MRDRIEKRLVDHQVAYQDTLDVLVLALVLCPEHEEPVPIERTQSAYIIAAVLDKVLKGEAGELLACLATDDLLTQGQELAYLFV